MLCVLIRITQRYPEFAALEFFQGTQERVRNSRGKRAISVRATEGLLYMPSPEGEQKNVLWSDLSCCKNM